MKREKRTVLPTDEAITPCRCCSNWVKGALLKATYVCDTCATTRRSVWLEWRWRNYRTTADNKARAEWPAAGIVPTCPKCQNKMRRFPAGVKLGKYLKKLKRANANRQ